MPIRVNIPSCDLYEGSHLEGIIDCLGAIRQFQPPFGHRKPNPRMLAQEIRVLSILANKACLLAPGLLDKLTFDPNKWREGRYYCLCGVLTHTHNFHLIGTDSDEPHIGTVVEIPFKLIPHFGSEFDVWFEESPTGEWWFEEPIEKDRGFWFDEDTMDAVLRYALLKKLPWDWDHTYEWAQDEDNGEDEE